MLSLAATRQYLVAAVGALSLFICGSSYTWSTPLLPELKRPGSEFELTPNEGSWVISLVEIGNLVPCIPAGFLVDKFGRKPCLLFTTPFYIITWLFILWYRTVPALYLMRVVQGLAMSVQFTVLPMYLAEISCPSRRGALGSFFQIMWNLGFLYEYILGAFFGYNGLTWFSIGPPVVFMIGFCFCPESPYFLLMRNRRDEAASTLAWLRGQALEESDPELTSIEQSLFEEKQEEGGWRDIVTTTSGRKALSIILVVGTIYIMSGLSTILCYVSDIFATTSKSQEEANMITVLVGVFVILATLLSTCLLDRLGRRPVLVYSAGFASILLAITGVFYYCSEKTNMDMSSYFWVPYVTIILSTTAMSVAVGAIPALQGELFPNKTRGIASAIYTLYITLLSFVCLKMYQVIGDYIGYFVDYTIFSVCTAIGTLYMFFYLPETKGKTFAEIQKILQVR